jgi:methyl-accepting chemotaxis protein
VAAQEVKNLAGQTVKATDEISAHIVNMQRATGESVDAIEAIGLTIERISEITT